MNSKPNYLTHYYEQKSGPFKSMTENGYENAREIFNTLKEEGKSAKSKFADTYVDLRMDVETWLRNGFIEKGGQPKYPYPQYTILGDCDWLLDWFEIGSKKIIPLSKLANKQVSFTYPDSMISYQMSVLKETTKEAFNQVNRPFLPRPCYGKVYLLEELDSVIKEFGLPNGSLKDGRPGTLDMYIEIQIWEDLE